MLQCSCSRVAYDAFGVFGTSLPEKIGFVSIQTPKSGTENTKRIVARGWRGPPSRRPSSAAASARARPVNTAPNGLAVGSNEGLAQARLLERKSVPWQPWRGGRWECRHHARCARCFLYRSKLGWKSQRAGIFPPAKSQWAANSGGHRPLGPPFCKRWGKGVLLGLRGTQFCCGHMRAAGQAARAPCRRRPRTFAILSPHRRRSPLPPQAERVTAVLGVEPGRLRRRRERSE